MSLVDELAKLEDLRRRGALSESEFTQAKAALLHGAATASEAGLESHLTKELREVRSQNQLTQLDREWEIERRQYLIRGRYGATYVPTTGMGIGTAVVGGVFGVLWTILAFSITSGAPDVGPFSLAKVIFPLFGVVFTGGAIGYGLYAYSQAQKYQEAFAAYKTRRTRVQPEQDAP